MGFFLLLRMVVSKQVLSVQEVLATPVKSAETLPCCSEFNSIVPTAFLNTTCFLQPFPNQNEHNTMQIVAKLNPSDDGAFEIPIVAIYCCTVRRLIKRT